MDTSSINGSKDPFLEMFSESDADMIAMIVIMIMFFYPSLRKKNKMLWGGFSLYSLQDGSSQSNLELYRPSFQSVTIVCKILSHQRPINYRSHHGAQFDCITRSVQLGLLQFTIVLWALVVGK